LLGGQDNAIQALAPFKDRNVGLVYAEDHHCMDEGDNGEAIARLLSAMDVPGRRYYHSFPLGTMFWARVEALAPLAGMDLAQFEIYEPVPYDGTTLHAFERILPVIAEHAGFRTVRVRRPLTTW